MVGAIKAHEEEERISRENGDREGLKRSWSHQMSILVHSPWIDKALELSAREEDAYREWGDWQEVATTLYRRAIVLYQAKNSPVEAIIPAQESLRLATQQGMVPLAEMATQLLMGVFEQISRQTVALLGSGDLDGALSLTERQETASRAIGDREWLQDAWENRAAILQRQGDCDGALSLLQKQVEICRELALTADLVRSLAWQATVLIEKFGRVSDALPLVEEVHSITEQVNVAAARDQLGSLLDGCPGLLQDALWNHAKESIERDDPDTALELYRENERFFKRLRKAEGIARAYAYQAWILDRMQRHDGALEVAEAAHEMATKHGTP